MLAPVVTRAFSGRAQQHRVLRHLPAFVAHVRERVWAQGQALGFVPAERPGLPYRLFAMSWGVALFVRSQFARSNSTLEKTYLTELGFTP
jgi:hypothetical protein